MIPLDPLLRELGAALRRSDPLADPRWEALAEGRLSPAHAQALRRMADRCEVPAAAFEALRPFDDTERRALLDAAMAALPWEADGASAPRLDGKRPIRPARRWRTWAAGAIAAVAAVACLALLGTRPQAPDGPGSPRVILSVVGDDSRGPGLPADGSAIRLERHDALEGRIEMTAPSPGQAPSGGPIEVRVLVVEGQAVRPVLTLQALEAERIAIGPIPRTALSTAVSGEVRLVFLLGKPGDFPDAEALREQVAGGRATPRLQRVSRPVQLVE